MLLAIDSGNSRVKWGLCDAARWFGGGARAVGDARLPGDLAAAAAGADAVRVCHVGSAAVKAQIAAACRRARFAAAGARAAGVINLYRPPRSLGADRWCALIAARRFYRAAVVVQAGTAATIDGLDERGRFIGGLILPGLAMSWRALAAGTNLPRVGAGAAGAMLPMANRPSPTNHPPTTTRGALAVGGLESVAQAALAFRRRYLPRRRIVITGGDAAALLSRLGAGAAHHPALALEGLRILHFDG